MFPGRHLNATITRWRYLGSDGVGGFLFAAPYVIQGRWEDRVELFRKPEGDEAASNAICYTSEDTAVGDYLVEGDYTDTADPLDVSGAQRVLQRNRMTDLRAMNMHYKAFM